MKNYSRIFILPFFLIICFTLISGFSGSSNSFMVEELLKERTGILHKAYYKQITIKQAEDLLYDIETHPLLTADIRELRNYEDTDIDMVKDMNLLSLEKTSDIYGKKSYIGKIQWNMLGFEGNYIQAINYNIVIKSSATGYKLSEFIPISTSK